MRSANTLYTALYMGATRTQVYLTPDQRARIDRLTARDGRALAEVVRAALDAYLAEQVPDPEGALDASFGATPDLRVPSRDEWARG